MDETSNMVSCSRLVRFSAIHTERTTTIRMKIDTISRTFYVFFSPSFNLRFKKKRVFTACVRASIYFRFRFFFLPFDMERKNTKKISVSSTVYCSAKNTTKKNNRVKLYVTFWLNASVKRFGFFFFYIYIRQSRRRRTDTRDWHIIIIIIIISDGLQ